MKVFVICLFVSVGISGYYAYYYAIPRIIQKRMTDLSLVRYDSKIDKMIVKDSLFLTSEDLLYIINGNTKTK